VILARHTQLGWFAFFAGLFIVSAAAGIYTGFYGLFAIPFAVIFFYAGWQNINACFFLLLLSLPFSFEYHFSPELGTDLPDELLMLLVSFLFFAYWCYKPGRISKETLKHPLLLLLAAWVCWMILSVVFSTRPAISIKYLLAKGWYFGAFILAPLIILKGKKAISIAAIMLVAAMAAVMFLTLVRHSYNDFSFASVNEAVYPFFRNHVNYSAMLVCAIPILLALQKLSGNRAQKLLIISVIGFSLLGLFVAYSRGAWLALLAGIISYGLVKRRLLLYTYLLLLVLSITSLFWIKSGDRYLRYAPDLKTTIFHKNFNEHLIATYKLKDISTAERFYRWIAGIRMIKDNPLTGYGPNAFYDNYKPYTIPAYKTWVSKNEDRSTVHNYFLLLVIEQGIPGLIFFLVLTGAMLYYAQYLFHRVKDIFYRTVAITAGVMLVMITVVNCLSDLIETDKIGSLFYLCLSVLVITDLNTREAFSKKTRHLKD